MHTKEVWDYFAQGLENKSIIRPLKENPFGKYARFSPVKFGDRVRQLINIYCLGRIVDFCSTSRLLPKLGDGSGTLSGGAFNQLKLVTLNIVLTILY